MKKSKKIGISVAVSFILLIVLLAVWQWDNIKAIYMGVTYSDKKIETKIDESKEKLAKKLEKEGIVDKKIIDGFSKEDEEKLAKGEISIEEAVDKLFEPEDDNQDDAQTDSDNNSGVKGDLPADKNESSSSETTVNKNKASSKDNAESSKTSEDNASTSKNNDNVEQKQPENNTTQNSAESSQSADSESKKLIEGAVKEMYTLKASYVQQLAAIERTAKKIYVQGEMTKERKLEIADTLMPQLVDAERSCDSQVEVILGKLKSDLSAVGADTSVVQDIREQYQNEKQLQKSKYISKYM